MGLLTRFILRNLRLLLSLLFCNKGLLPPAHGNAGLSQRERAFGEGAIFGSSLLHDIFDWINFGLDFTFCVKLFQLPDSILYAIVLTIGLILGRIVAFRGTFLLFQQEHSGIHWSPFWIAPCYIQTPLKYRTIFPQLYCLVFTEMSVFLLQDYPSLSTYAHWVTINKIPAPLQDFDEYNIAFSAIMLCLLLALFLIAIFTSLLRLTWSEWTRREKALNSAKIIVFMALLTGLMWYLADELKAAIRFAYQGDKTLPDNTIMGIPFCEPVSFKDRFDFCDEESFAIHVAFAWLAAIYFSAHVFFRPATAETFMDHHDDFKMKSMRAAVHASTLDAAAAAAAALSASPLDMSKPSKSRNANSKNAAAWYPSSPTDSVTHVNDKEDEYYEDDEELGGEHKMRRNPRKDGEGRELPNTLPLVPFPPVESARKGRSATATCTADDAKRGTQREYPLNLATTTASGDSTNMTTATSTRSSRPKAARGDGDVQWHGSVTTISADSRSTRSHPPEIDLAAIAPPIPRRNRHHVENDPQRHRQQQHNDNREVSI